MVKKMTVELVPDRNLIDPEFAGYRLSLQDVPAYSVDVLPEVDVAGVDTSQFSYLCIRLFSLHNHLVADPWNNGQIYYINQDWRIMTASVNSEDNNVIVQTSSWDIPKKRSRVPGDYNLSLAFADSCTAVCSDGCGKLYILRTGERCKDISWKVEQEEEPLNGSASFVIADARCCSSEQIDIALVRIEEKNDAGAKAQVCTAIYWVIYEFSEGTEAEAAHWIMKKCEKIVTTSVTHYMYFAEDCSCLLIGSEQPLEFPNKVKNEDLALQTGTGDSEEVASYYWQQSVEDLQVWFPLGENYGTDQKVYVDTTDTHVQVEINGKAILAGDLPHRIESYLTTWQTVNNRLEVTLFKGEQGLIWECVVEGDERGEQVLDPELVKQIHQRLANLCSDKEAKSEGDGKPAPRFSMQQLEECDDVPCEHTILYCVDKQQDFDVTSQANIGGHQWLCNVRTDARLPPLFCTRHDVDAFLWKVDYDCAHQKCSCTHVATVDAFGYVQASKDAKYTTCSSDLSYSVIAKCSQNVFVYKKASIDGSCFNRKTKKQHTETGAQHLISLNKAKNEDIIGVFASPKVLFVLTKSTLYAYFIPVAT